MLIISSLSRFRLGFKLKALSFGAYASLLPLWDYFFFAFFFSNMNFVITNAGIGCDRQWTLGSSWHCIGRDSTGYQEIVSFSQFLSSNVVLKVCYLALNLLGAMSFSSECQMVMNVLWTRLAETGKDWRYVYKVPPYLLLTRSMLEIFWYIKLL